MNRPAPAGSTPENQAWQSASDQQLRDFLALTPTLKFRLLMEMIETMKLLDSARSPIGKTDSLKSPAPR